MSIIDLTAAREAIERTRAEKKRQDDEDRARRAKAKSYPKFIGANGAQMDEEPPIVITRTELVELIQDEIAKAIKAYDDERAERDWQERMGDSL